MATSTSPTSTRTTVDMELVEYTFARWVYIDKCYDFVDANGNPAPDIKAVMDTLGSETACIRTLILHGHMANGRQTRHSRANGLRGPTPLEVFKEALRIGLAAAEDPTDTMVDIPTRPWECTSQSIFWLPVPLPDLPVFIPRPLTSSTWGTVNPSGTTTASGTDLIRAPRELSTLNVNPTGNVKEDLSAVWRCSEADILYRNGECTVYPRLQEMKPFVVTGLPPVHPHVLQHSQSDSKAGPFYTTARSVSSQDVKDTPMLLIWSCIHGDLFVQAPRQVPVLPPISSFDFVNSSIPPSSHSKPLPSPTSLKRYALVSPSHDHRPSPLVLHSSPTPAPRSQPMFPSGRPHPRQRQRPIPPSSAPYPAPGILPPLSQRSIQRVKARGPTHPKVQSLAVSTRRNTQVLPLPRSAPRPTPPSLSVFKPRTPCTSNDVPPLPTPRTPVSEKRARGSDPTPGPSNLSAPTSSISTPPEPTPPGSADNTPCGFDNCDATVTPSSWERHYDVVHGISERTWVADSLCPHPACRKAQAQAAARTQPKLTIGAWPTYKRHVKQMHFPKGRTHRCAFPGCDAVLSRGDALLRHVESKHKVVHVGRERAGKRMSTERAADSEEGPKRKKARMRTSPNKERAARTKASPKKTSAVHEKASVALTGSPPASRKGKEVTRGGDTRENRDPGLTSTSSRAGPSRINISVEDVDMVDDEDDSTAQSEDEYEDEWPQGDIIEDEMNFDSDNYY